MLLGRSRQVEEIGQLLSDARARRGRALLVSGEPGIGKTALLACAREIACDAGIEVIQAVGVEAEAKLPFAALGEVAGPLLDHLGELPDRQAAAIEAALAMGESSGTFHDPLAVCVGFLGLLRAAAEHRPLLVLVDDAHWLDEPSAECVGYAARRLGDTAVGLLAAARPVVDRPPLDGRLTDDLTLGGLPEEDARELLRRRAGDVAPATTQALLDAAAGNPLALIELPTLLTDEQRRGAAPFEPALARGGALWHAFERQVAAQATTSTWRCSPPPRRSTASSGPCSPPATTWASGRPRSSAPKPPGWSSSTTSACRSSTRCCAPSSTTAPRPPSAAALAEGEAGLSPDPADRLERSF